MLALENVWAPSIVYKCNGGIGKCMGTSHQYSDDIIWLRTLGHLGIGRDDDEDLFVVWTLYKLGGNFFICGSISSTNPSVSVSQSRRLSTGSWRLSSWRWGLKLTWVGARDAYASENSLGEDNDDDAQFLVSSCGVMDISGGMSGEL